MGGMKDVVTSSIVADGRWGLGRVEGGYAAAGAAPYGPGEAYPEFAGRGVEVQGGGNGVFAAVREALRGLGLDAGRFGQAGWNPLGALVRKGGSIVVKPNWVLHRNMKEGAGMECMVTHPSVLRAVLEYVFLAEPGRVVLGDAPLQNCDFAALQAQEGLPEVLAEFARRGLAVEVKDFRRTTLREVGELKTDVSEELRPESEYVLVDLGADSLLEEISGDWEKFRVTVYDPRKMRAHHRPGRHRYLLAREVLEADLVVNCPKLKTHKKAGMTCCLKNLVGINGNKEYLPHHRKGGADGGGDNYAHRHWKMSLAEELLDEANRRWRGWPRVYRLLERVAWRLMVKHRKEDPMAQLEGSWKGNDTIWRTCLDLNRALIYAGKDGRMREEPQREEVSIVDAVVTGQGLGPLEPDALATGAVYAAHNPAAGDEVGARLLGLRREMLPLVRESGGRWRWPVFTGRCETAGLEGFPGAKAPWGWEGLEQPGGCGEK